MIPPPILPAEERPPTLLVFTPAPPEGLGGAHAVRTRQLTRGGLGTAVEGLTAALRELGVATRFADVMGFDEDPYSAVCPASFDPHGADEACEIAWAHDWMSGHAAHAWATRHDKPWILHLHSTARERCGGQDKWIDPITFEAERELAHLADRVVCVSERTADVVREDYGVDPARLAVVHNGQPDLDTLAVRKPGRDIACTFIGRFDWHKAPDKFLEAARILVREDGKRRFVMGGDGPLRSLIEARIRALDLERVVYPTPWLAPESRDMVLARTRVLMMPSPAEPFGLVALEAIAFGAIPLVDVSAGVREVLPSCPAVDASNPRLLAAAASELLALSPKRRKRLVARLRGEAWRASWSRSAGSLLEVVREVLGQGA